MKTSKNIKIAFVGCGGIAQAHWNGIQAHAPQLKVTATIDTDPDRAAAMAKQTGGQAFISLDAALAQGDFDAVDIMLPHHLHEETTLQAFAAGKHVVLEKPMATTLDSCERILNAAHQAGTVFMIAEQTQYEPGIVKTRQLIQEGVIGEILTARALFGGKASTGGGVTPWRNSKAITGGGICIDGGLHWIRPLRMWMGEIDEAMATLHYPNVDMEGESMAHALLRFVSGKVAVFDAIRAGNVSAPGEKFRVTGNDGVIVIDKGRKRQSLLYNIEYPQGLEILTEAEKGSSSFGLELADFARAVSEGTGLAAGPEASVADLRTVLAMYRSAESRQWEKVWD